MEDPSTISDPQNSIETPPPPTLSIDLITEILLRLPPKPLARFKMVSKPWNNLIRSRKFILSHINRSLSSLSNLHLALFSNYTSNLFTLDLPALDSSPPKTATLSFPSEAQDSDLFGSAHGLLGISDYPNFLSLYNPTNATFRVIPVKYLSPRAEAHWVDFGLGHDPASDDYKIVRVDQLNGPGAGSKPRGVRVYSVKEGSWRKIKDGFPHFLAHPKAHGKFVNGSLLFMATINPPAVYDLDTLMAFSPEGCNTAYDHYVIVKFDLITEKFSTIEMPSFVGKKKHPGKKRRNAGWKKKVKPSPSLAVLGGNLSVLVEYGPKDSQCVDVWVMREFGAKESWARLLSFPFQEARPKAFGSARPVFVSEASPDEVLMEQHCAYFWYNVRTGKVRDVEVRGHLPQLFAWFGGHPCDFGAVPYVGSLVALDNAGLEHAEVRRGSAGGIGDIVGGNFDFITSGRATVHGDRLDVPIVGFRGKHC